MMAGNPNWWTMNPHESVFDHFPIRSWSQFLLGGGDVDDGEDRDHQNKMENWEDQVLDLNPCGFPSVSFNDAKEELVKSTSHQLYKSDDFPPNRPENSWLSSPSSSITSLGNGVLNFSGAKMVAPPVVDHLSPVKKREYSLEKGMSSGGDSKKARVQNSSCQPMLKVRKEKLGDRITALHQLVSPFGKTDTASVLSEAIGYIRFLQAQIEALSSPYMRNQHCESRSGLRSRGLCLVPISCTQNVGNDTGADYWAPSSIGGGN